MTDSAFDGLVAIVQYRIKRNGTMWCNMAAFDSIFVAEEYAMSCTYESSPYEYRFITAPDNTEDRE